ncbi:MAG TPA: ABC transporter permease, partial [Vicinamibacterales bacterium]|nr:ABC transporter permease [Vicinamibacterales bacterium]
VRAEEFNDALAARARQIPGVVSVAVTSHVPLHGGVRRARVTIAAVAAGAPEMTIVSSVSPEYFATLQIPLVAGRTFTAGERGTAMIGEGLARRFWPGDSALGHTVHVEGLPAEWTIVGVVRDAANAAIWREKEMALYLPAGAAADPRDLHLIVRTSGDAGVLAQTLDAGAASLEPDLRFEAVTLESLLRTWLLPSRVAAVAATTLAILALTLACIGVYCVLSFTVAQRMREIGIRMALGADARGIIALVLRDGGRMLAIGLVIGSGCALPAAPLLGRLLFDVSAFDPITMIAVPFVLALSALGACYVPARRASRLPPLAVLRVE